MSDSSPTDPHYIQGRGAQINPPNPFDKTHYTHEGQIWHDPEEMLALRATSYIETHPKTIINKVESPDIPFSYSLNPYQGCEHGCVYCYARNTHTYWGYSAGIEFEQKILIKHNAPLLLSKQLASKNWVPQPIMLSGNTDCYQPAERQYELTKKILDVALQFRHPIGIITKNSLILRDIAVLRSLAEHNLVHVSITITTLDENTRLNLEPRTVTGTKRIEVIRSLSKANIPTSVMIGPIIPSLNDHEIPEIARLSAEAGALDLHYTMLRLNGDVQAIFKDWLQKNYPDRYDRVMHQTASLHGGQINDSRYSTRMRGEGNLADILRQQVALVKRKYFAGRVMPLLNTEEYLKRRDPQLSLF